MKQDVQEKVETCKKIKKVMSRHKNQAVFGN